MGRILGVPVYVSPSWFLVAALVTIMFEGQVHDVVTRPASYLVAFTYAALLYGSVFVHELSHAVTARAFGLPVRSVTLHILGGETAIEREAPTPGREFLIAFAGPLTNLLLAGAGLLAHATLTLPDVALLLLEALTFANLLVGLFNLLPGLPLDGGRLVRAAVWKATGNSRNGAVFAGLGRPRRRHRLPHRRRLPRHLHHRRRRRHRLARPPLVRPRRLLHLGRRHPGHPRRTRPRPHPPPLRTPPRPPRHPRHLRHPLAEAIRRAHDDHAGAIVIADHDGRPLGLVNEKAVTATPEHRRPWITAGELSRGIDDDLILPATLTGEELIDALRRAPATEYLLTEPDGRVYGVLATTDVDRAFTGI
ncbi:site-2 protease family protein [Actinomadura madurae]|uniref:site-2 protease family protein n=1 Tax=Actinomadura madurae TaxID=1993 RepID=UPI0020D24578|nr:site-2 protease family protein [Actinomadura madurae]MCQ0013274.1 M50 family metallopeptidase [Actinomadura madurae]